MLASSIETLVRGVYISLHTANEAYECTNHYGISIYLKLNHSLSVAYMPAAKEKGHKRARRKHKHANR